MKDIKLLELLENYFLMNECEELVNYIKRVEIDESDYKKIILCLAKKDLFNYADCNCYKKLIENIDNEDFMNDESNYI